MAKISSQQNGDLSCRILLDTAATANFITESLVSQLKLPKQKCSLAVGGIDGLSTRTKHLVTAKIQSTNGKYCETFQFLTIPSIAEFIPSQTIQREKICIPDNVKLADPEFYKPRPVDILLGSGATLSLFTSGQYHLTNKDNAKLVLQKTRLGWIIGGNFSSSNQTKIQRAFHTSFNLEKFWEVEEGMERQQWSPEEQAAEEHFQKNYGRDSTGRYIVALPLKHNHSELGDSRESALKQFQALEKRFQRNPEFKRAYSTVMEEYIELGHMSEDPNPETPGFYFPHHAVFKSSSLTTALRVVFNASVKTPNGLSLNDVLMVGPTIQDDIFSLIIRFRTHQHVITADIEKMYRQFLIRPEDRRYQRVFWKDKCGKLKVYILNTVTFGTASAPFDAIRGLQQLAKDESKTFPLAARILLEDMYVDDLLTGFETIKEAGQAISELIQLLKRGGLNIRQWASNTPRILQNLPPESINQRLQFDDDKTLKTLGISWDSQGDMIKYAVKPIQFNKSITKRTILSDIATIFDPLGLLGPVILKAKNIMQQLWTSRVDWDEPISLNIQTLWHDFCTQLPLINDIQFNRKTVIQSATDVQIHGFCDASETGYGACIYLKSTNTNGISQINLICSKSRVAPLKTISIPRLELCGALTLTNLLNLVKKAIKLPISKTVLWTDSMITLHWINSPPHTLKTFVQNRVSEIQQKTENCEWKHVKSEDNPADALSRGQLPTDFIQNKLWTTGPRWLIQSEDCWPMQTIHTPSEDIEARQITCLKTSFDTSIFTKFQSFNLLVRALAHCFRLAAIIRKERRWNGSITATEFEETRIKLVKMIQQDAFAEEIHQLQQPGKDSLKQSNRLTRLNPFIDDQGVLRVGGRLDKASIPEAQRHPTILPQNNHVTNLIIKQEHHKNLHSGVQATLFATRLNYWILDGRNQVRGIIHKCVTCRRLNPPVTNYVMGNLPAARVNQTIRPFVNTGVDYCGPFHVKEKKHRNRGRVKVYVAVFICLAVKAVHLEVVSDLTSAGFLAALQRFMARRGKPTTIHSDNGTNFTGAHNEMKSIIDQLRRPEEEQRIITALTPEGITWQFTPPHSPHFGGVWEAAVKSFKHHLIRVMGNHLLTFEEFNTLTIKIEGILNSRPITAMSTDPNDLQALTPGHFLVGTVLTSIPELDYTDTKLNTLSRWELIKKLKQDFWARWNKEYLNELNVRRRWTTGTHNIRQHSIVVLKEDNLAPLQWKLGRVTEVHPGPDNIIRVVTVKTATGLLKRNVKSLAPLPVTTDVNT